MILRITIIGLLAGVIGTGLGGIISALFKRNVDRYLDFFMGLSGGIMLAVVVFDLMKESMNEIGVLPTVIFTFVGVLLTMFLKTKLDKSVFLDGDWCWDMHPFMVNEETKKLVLENICMLLNNDLKCSVFDHIIFCWVMHEQSIIDDLLSRLDLNDVKVIAISLVCQKEALEKRIQKDIDQGIRKPDVLARSVERLEMYQKLNTYKIDVSNKTIEEIVKEIIKVGDEND